MARFRTQPPEKRPKAVLLDLDDTLYPYEASHQAGLSAMQAQMESELGIPREVFEEFYPKARKEVKTRFGKFGKSASAHSRLLYAARMLEMLGMKTQPAMALRLEATYWRSFLVVCEPFSGVEAFLRELRANDVPICIVTDLTMAIQYRKIVHLRLEELIDWVVTSEETQGDKPTHLPFFFALEKLGLNEEDPVWVFGDSGADVQAGRAALPEATTFLRISPHNRELIEHADAGFEDFRELTGWVRKTLGTRSEVAPRFSTV